MEAPAGKRDAPATGGATTTPSATNTTCTDPGLVDSGHRLLAFIQAKKTHLRHVRRGRQSLYLFANSHPLPEHAQSPPEWNEDISAATAALEGWLKIPNNPFVKDRDETQGTTHERERTTITIRAPEESRHHSRGTEGVTAEMLQTMLDQIRLLTHQIEIIKCQNEEIKCQHEELKRQNEETKAQNEKMGKALEEVLAKTIGRLTVCSHSPQSSVQTRSYAEMAAAGIYHTNTPSPSMLSPLIAITPPSSAPELRSVSSPDTTSASAEGNGQMRRAKFIRH